MKGRANTTITVLRGTTADDYGDQADTATEVATAVPASILEVRRTRKRFDSTAPERIRSFAGRVGSQVDVRQEDRIRDERSLTIYIVDDVVAQPGHMGHTPDTRLDLRQVD